MKYDDYKKWSDRATEWIASYFASLPDRPVRAQSKPGAIAAQIDNHPPEFAEGMEAIFGDFEALIPDGMTHWQHPRFFAYFPANAAPASMIAEQLANAISAQCMLWQTSPAATELEVVMVDWLRMALGLPDRFKGVIHDSASSATLAAIVTMRERAQNFQGQKEGYAGATPCRIYCSDQVHSSIDKACWIAGIGQDNLVKIPTDSNYSMRPDLLQSAIDRDRSKGLRPAGLVVCIGGTSIGASDDLPELVKIAKQENIPVHLDAAWAGSAMICEELRDLWKGSELCDSIVFNPHKWLGAQFDCCVQFLADPTDQIRTLGIKPSYLLTQGEDDIINFSEWTVPLGRRFRALKLWFVMRAYGLDGLRTRIRNHIQWAQELEAKIGQAPNLEIVTSCRLSLFTFQFTPSGLDANEATAKLLKRINDDGRIYLTQTTHQEKFVIRIQVGQFDCTRDDVMMIYEVISELIQSV